MRTIVLILLLLVLARIGCDRIKVAEDKYRVIKKYDGTIYRFDPKTGEELPVEKDKIVPPPSPAVRKPAPEIVVTKSAVQSPAPVIDEIKPAVQKPAAVIDEPKPAAVGVQADLPEISIPGKKVKMRLRTNWLEGKLKYVFEVYPYDSFVKHYSGQTRDPAHVNRPFGFEVILADSKSVVVHSIRIDFWTMTAARDEQGKKSMLTASSQIDCSSEEFDRLASYSVTYDLDLDAIPSISFDEEMSDSIAQMPKMYGKNPANKNGAFPGAAKYWVDAGNGIKRYFSTREELERISAGSEK